MPFDGAATSAPQPLKARIFADPSGTAEQAAEKVTFTRKREGHDFQFFR
jgi:hypothetical protein